jgi:hypothetical protein
MGSLYLETFVAGQSFKFHCTLDDLIGSFQILLKVEYFPTGVINKQTAACIVRPFMPKTVWQTTLDWGKIMVGRYLTSWQQFQPLISFPFANGRRAY